MRIYRIIVGYDKEGKPIYAPDSNLETQNISMLRHKKRSCREISKEEYESLFDTIDKDK